MLSKLFNSAVTFFHSAPPTKGTQKKQLGTRSPLREMVTTRGQSGKHAIDTGSIADDAKVVGTPGSSRKRQRKAGNSEALELRDNGDARTPATKKQKILSTDGGESRSSSTKKGKALPVRAKDDETPNRKTRAVVEIPAFQGGLGSSGRKLKKSREEVAENEEEPQKSDADTSRVEEVPDSESESNDNKSGPKPSKSPMPRGNKKMKQKDSVNKETPEVTEAISSPANIPAKPKHKRFGSEEPETPEVPEAEVFSTAPEILESEDESSDDDAPEVVGAQEALETAKLREREAAKAVEVQEAAIRKKRKERDAILKEQAKAAAKKRKREEEEIQVPVEAGVLTDAHENGIANPGSEDANDDAQNNEPLTAKPSLKLTPRASLPEFLPAEYLEEDEESEETLQFESTPQQQQQPVKKAKKTKFTDLVEKKPKDIRKGSTIYRVAEARNMKLPPKSSFQARSVKESWLQGRSGSGIGTNRKPFSNSFYKAK